MAAPPIPPSMVRVPAGTSTRHVRKLFLWGPPLLLMVAIFIASSMPPLPAGVVSDKTSHFGVYGMLAALLLRAFVGGRWGDVCGVSASKAVVVATAYGITDELHQGFVPVRHPEIADVVFDAAGAVAAVGLLWAWSILTRVRAA